MAESAALGRGAWDCDTNSAIPADKEAAVFEEIATNDYPFEGMAGCIHYSSCRQPIPAG
jgi:hypothetical protein